jgi:hypothetical protein
MMATGTLSRGRLTPSTTRPVDDPRVTEEERSTSSIS